MIHSVAVISDIHGNCFALDRVLEDLRKHPAGQIVCLGDAIQGGAQPAQTVGRLRQVGCPVVMGNADAWLLTGEVTNSFEQVSPKQLEAREWALGQLSADDRSFIEGFQSTVEVALGDTKLLCFHGSPASFDDVILPDTPEEEVQALLAAYLPSIMTGGHTHTQFVRRLGDNAFFFNPGSVGVAYNRYLPDARFHLDAWAEYVILTVEEGRVSLEFRRIPYDVDEFATIALASGRPNAEEFVGQYRH